MHMIDVMKKLQEIAEDGYNNEDIQRGIDAAGKHTVAEAQSPAQKAAFQKMLDDEEEAVEEAVEAVELEEGGSGDAPISKMSRAELIDYLGTTDAEVVNMSDDELRDAANEKTMDMQSVDNNQPAVEETVEVPVNELAELMQLAGYTNYAEKIEEYANEPEEDYMDAEEQLIGLSGGLNGPKKMYAAAAGGDNPMDQEPREVTESTFESFYKKYDKFVAELTESEQDK